MGTWLARLRQFISDTLNELRKCSWTPKNELFESTVLVIVSVFMLAGFVSLADLVFRRLIGLLMM
jgi:preprotein translocase SecE subunit